MDSNDYAPKFSNSMIKLLEFLWTAMKKTKYVSTLSLSWNSIHLHGLQNDNNKGMMKPTESNSSETNSSPKHIDTSPVPPNHTRIFI